MAKFWKEDTINLGRVKIGSTFNLTFNALEMIPEIRKVLASCGCTTTGKVENGVLPVKYKVKPVPKQLAQRGDTEYKFRKVVTVMYNGAVNDILAITGTAYK